MDVTRIPKIELHLHLDGAVPPETMWRMAQEKHVSLPVDTLDEFYAWLVKTADCRDVNTYLARFELPLQLMQDAPGITRITCDVLTTLARQGHIYDELRFAPQLHTRAGLRQQDAIEAVLAGREQALRAFPDYRCGILLCCMCIGPETANMAENLETVRLTQEYLGSGVVGMDLAGAEGIVPLRNFHPIFDLARELGLPFTLKELRNYELLKWGRQHQDRELTDDEMAADDETTYWLLDRGWSNDEAAFCGGEH